MTPTWAAVTKRLVDDLHAHLIIGLNMESDNLKVAQAELQEIQTGIAALDVRSRYQLGNEPELYNHFPFYHAANGAAVLGRPRTLFAHADVRRSGTTSSTPYRGCGLPVPATRG